MGSRADDKEERSIPRQRAGQLVARIKSRAYSRVQDRRQQGLGRHMGAPTAQRAQQPGSCLVGLGKPAPKLDEKTELFVCLEAAVHVVGCYNIVRGHVIGD